MLLTKASASAQWLLASMYELGSGVPQDYVQAYMWCNLSAAKGFQLAIYRRAELEKLMTPAQIAESQNWRVSGNRNLSGNWFPLTRPWVRACRFPQKEIFADEHAVLARQWPAAFAAAYLTICGFRPSFGFDNVIKRVAMRAVEMNCRGFGRHTQPPPLINSSDDIRARRLLHVLIIRGVSKASAASLYVLRLRRVSCGHLR